MSTHKVSTLAFRRNIYKFLDKMPLEVTAKGETKFFVVKTLDGTQKTSTVPENREEVKTCSHGMALGLCKFGCE